MSVNWKISQRQNLMWAPAEAKRIKLILSTNFNNRCKNSAKEWRFELGYINCGKKKMLIPTPGIEPGPRRWERRILTTRPCGNRQTSGRKHLFYVVRSAHRNFSICCLCCPFLFSLSRSSLLWPSFLLIFFQQNRNCLGFNPYPRGVLVGILGARLHKLLYKKNCFFPHRESNPGHGGKM